MILSAVLLLGIFLPAVEGYAAAATLVPFNGGWYYVNNGTIDNQSTTMVQYNNNWYYVNKGKVNLRTHSLRDSYTEFFRYNSDGSYRVDYFDDFCSEERYHTADGKIRNSIIYDNFSDDYDVLTYTYNSRNKPISPTEYVDGDFEYAEYYVYDAQGRVIRTLWKDNYDTYLTTHTYNQSGQLMWETTYYV